MSDDIEINPGYIEHEFRRSAYMDSEPYKEYRRMWKEYPRRGVVSPFPLNLDVEINNTCNLRCPFCVREFMNEGTGLMEMEQFVKICREAKHYHLPAMKLCWRGEPTMHPRLAEMVYNAKRAGVLEVMFNTNGTMLTAKLSRELIRAGLDKIIFSIDSIDPHSYATKYRKGADLKKVLANLTDLLEVRKQLQTDRPYVRVQKIDFPETRKEDYVSFFENLGVDCVAINSYKEKDATKVDWEVRPCAQPFQRLFITWRGEYRVCCQGQLFPKLGTMERMTAHEAWHSPMLTEIRRHQLQRTGAKIACKKCEVTRGVSV